MTAFLASPRTWSFDAADWGHLGLAALGLALAAWLIRRGPRETATFGRAELAGWSIAAGFLAYFIAQPWFIRTPEQGAAEAPFYALVGAQRLGIALVIAVVSRALLTDENPLGLHRPRRFRPVLWGLALYGAILPFMLFLGRFHDPEPVQESARRVAEAAGTTVPLAQFFMLVLATPIFEEVVFRGLLQGGLRRNTGPEASLLISALVFMLVHPQPLWPQVLCLGALLGIAYERTRTLWTSIAIHVVHNAATFLYLAFFYEESSP
ncbi:MAG: type II CAAX endopeptidase family protein [Planctomycetota bacterium]